MTRVLTTEEKEITALLLVGIRAGSIFEVLYKIPPELPCKTCVPEFANQIGVYFQIGDETFFQTTQDIVDQLTAYGKFCTQSYSATHTDKRRLLHNILAERIRLGIVEEGRKVKAELDEKRRKADEAYQAKRRAERHARYDEEQEATRLSVQARAPRKLAGKT